jgi:hypothetical protein
MGGPVDIPGDQLRTIVERIEHIEKEISELNEGKKESIKKRRATASILKSFEGSPLAKARPEGARGARVPARGLSESDQWSSGLQGRLIRGQKVRRRAIGSAPRAF